MAAIGDREALGGTTSLDVVLCKTRGGLVLCKTRGGLKVKHSLEDRGDGADLVQVWWRKKWSLDMRERRGKERDSVCPSSVMAFGTP